MCEEITYYCTIYIGIVYTCNYSSKMWCAKLKLETLKTLLHPLIAPMCTSYVTLLTTLPTHVKYSLCMSLFMSLSFVYCVYNTGLQVFTGISMIINFTY